MLHNQIVPIERPSDHSNYGATHTGAEPVPGSAACIRPPNQITLEGTLHLRAAPGVPPCYIRTFSLAARTGRPQPRLPHVATSDSRAACWLGCLCCAVPCPAALPCPVHPEQGRVDVGQCVLEPSGVAGADVVFGCGAAQCTGSHPTLARARVLNREGGGPGNGTSQVRPFKRRRAMLAWTTATQ